MAEPTHTGFMDADMRMVWERLEPLPGDLRLYGGTALALYLDHWASRDFDFEFMTPLAVIDDEFVGQIPVVGEGEVNGLEGYVGVHVGGPNRAVSMRFRECGHVSPMPAYEPVKAPNGIAVAHPVDLMAVKLADCMTLPALRHYEDMAVCIRAWPEWTRDAVGVLTAGDRVRETDVRRMLASPPAAFAGNLDVESRVRLRGFAQDFRMAQGKGGLHL